MPGRQPPSSRSLAGPVVAGGAGEAHRCWANIEPSAEADRIEGPGQQGTRVAPKHCEIDQLEAVSSRIRQSASSFWA